MEVAASTPGTLTIIFLVLKLTGVINWPWVWVLSPVWITIGLVLIILLFMVGGTVKTDWVWSKKW